MLMRLDKIKLAGFKSFVEPTTIPIPGHLVAIVGPNGCGKSNIIDAVRWVMGESSAKHLRGGTMADVILVSRFCPLVEEMSQSVQFLYISHNKLTMEIAKHLTGVTMKEPGVSRMVAVDIEQAVDLAGL